MFNIISNNPNENEVCPYCGYYEGSPPKELYHLFPGTKLYKERYIVGTVIGFGGFGITYKAWDSVLETVVAIKEYYPTGLAQRVPGNPQVIVYTGESKNEYMQNLERFLDEAKNMARFSANPNIVHVDAFFEENNTAYLVMEYLDGITLKSYLKSHSGRIEWKEAVNIADAVIDALRDMHKAEIIHRDISPDNIILCIDGRIKVIDFGAARFSDIDQERTRSIILKPGYAPPEQYQAKSKQGPWTDIYALAATIYRAITGVVPDESVNRVIEDTVCPPNTLCPDIPENISNAIMKGISIYPEIRFANVDEFKMALDGKKNVKAPKQELKTRRFRRTITVSVAVVLVALLSLLVFSMYRDKKSNVVMESATISVWIAVNSDKDSVGTKAMMESAIKAFTDTQENVVVDYRFIPEDSYAQELQTAFSNGEMPTIYQSEYATKEMLDQASALDKVYEYMDDIDVGDCYFIEELKEEIEDSKSIPLSFDVPIAYVKRSSEVNNIDTFAISGYDQLSELKDNQYYISDKSESIVLKTLGMYNQKKVIDLKRESMWKNYDGGLIYNAFIDEDKMIYFLGSTGEYDEVNEKWAGRYKVATFSTDQIIVKLTNKLSISGNINDSSKKAASLYISYLLKQEGQENLFLGVTYENEGISGLAKKEGLPLNKEALRNYLDTNSELSVIDSYFDKMSAE